MNKNSKTSKVEWLSTEVANETLTSHGFKLATPVNPTGMLVMYSGGTHGNSAPEVTVRFQIDRPRFLDGISTKDVYDAEVKLAAVYIKRVAQIFRAKGYRAVVPRQDRNQTVVRMARSN